MTADFAALSVGREISSRTFVLGAAMVARYVEAVGDQSGIFDLSEDRPVVPAMAVAALSLRGVLDDLGIPEGTVHVGQELGFSGVARVGDELTCKATVAQNSVRRDSRFVGLRLSVESGAGREIMSGKSTLVMPA
jgi:hypothetical protein